MLELAGAESGEKKSATSRIQLKSLLWLLQIQDNVVVDLVIEVLYSIQIVGYSEAHITDCSNW